jgi:hypothetical protein
MKFEPLVESIARVRRLSRNARPALLRLRDTPQVRAPVLGRQAPGLALSGREEPALAHRRARDPPRQGRCRRSVPLNRPERAVLREWLAHHADHHSKPSVTSGPV